MEKDLLGILIMFGPIEVIAFDLDNTLYEEALYFQSVFKCASEALGFDCELAFDFNRDMIENDDDILGNFLKRIGRYSLAAQAKLFEGYKYSRITLELDHEKRMFLRKVRSKFKICILTNGVIEAQENKIRALNIEELFDEVFYARFDGVAYEKPHPKAFQRICDYFACSPEDVLFVGDHPISDIRGAKEFGMRAVWTSEYSSRTETPLEADMHICSLLELSRVVEVA